MNDPLKQTPPAELDRDNRLDRPQPCGWLSMTVEGVCWCGGVWNGRSPGRPTMCRLRVPASPMIEAPAVPPPQPARELSPALKKAARMLRESLEWVGPQGRGQGIIMLPRDLAQAVVDELESRTS